MTAASWIGPRTGSGHAVAGYVAEVGLERCRELLDATEPAWWPTSFARRLLRVEVADSERNGSP